MQHPSVNVEGAWKAQQVASCDCGDVRTLCSRSHLEQFETFHIAGKHRVHDSGVISNNLQRCHEHHQCKAAWRGPAAQSTCYTHALGILSTSCSTLCTTIGAARLDQRTCRQLHCTLDQRIPDSSNCQGHAKTLLLSSGFTISLSQNGS